MSDRLFVYGTLQPGASAWSLLSPFTVGEPRRAVLPGALYDTGRGYPALSAMDSYEGAEYRRVLVRLPDGTACWTYEWIDGFDGLRLLTTPWAGFGAP